MSARARSTWLRRPIVLVAIVATVMCFAGIFQHGLWTPDEPREAEIGREMLLSGWSPLPTLSGEPFLEKPPLFPWVMAACYRVFGVSPGVARMPAALFSIGAILVAYALGRRAGGRLAGVLASIILATCVGFAQVSHSAVNDTALIFFVSAGHLAFFVARDRIRDGRATWAFATAGACAGLAFLTKGFIGPVLLCGPPILASLALREWTFVRIALPRAAAWSVLFVLAFGVPWVLALASTAGWSAVRVCLVDNTLGRSVAGVAPEFGHAHGTLYYLQTIPVVLLPWLLVVPAMITNFVRSGATRSNRARWLGLVFLAGLVLLSIPATKRELYALPLFPAIAAAMAVWLARVGSPLRTRSQATLDRVTLHAFGLVLGLVLFSASALFVLASTTGVVPARIQGDVSAIVSATSGMQRGIAIGVAALFSLIAVAAALRSRSRAAGVLAASTALIAVLAWHATLAPLIDPVKDMSRGARATSLAISAAEPLLGVFLDETTRAVLPYYGGRTVQNAADSERAGVELAAGPARHLIVMEAQDSKISAELRSHLRRVDRILLTSTRALIVYRYE